MINFFHLNKKNILKLSIILVLVCMVCLTYYLMKTKRNNKLNSKIKLCLGLPLQPQSSLLIIALEKGLFKKYGLQICVKEYPSGKRVLNEGFFTNKMDLASAADLPVAKAAIMRNNFKIIASICIADNVNSIISRKNAGIAAISDLKGKRIATQKNSAVHYFLELFLAEHLISKKDINLSFMKAEDLPMALAEGKIDAFSMREPYIEQAKNLLKNNNIVFSIPGLYTQYEVLLLKEDFLKKYPYVTNKILKALFEAEKYIQEFPDKSFSLIANRLNIEKKSISKLFSDFSFQISLDQSLIIRLEDEARWIISDQKIKDKSVPNYLKFIHQETLQKLRPESISIF